MDTNILLLITGAGLVMYVLIYNGLVAARQKVKESWSGVDVQLKKRYNLIPNLVKAVEGYTKHENQTLEELTKLRSEAIKVSDDKIAQQAEKENMITGALRSVFAVAENYPDLKASQNFLQLQEELTQIEDQISAARRLFNGNVTNLNVKVESFPSNIIANIHHFNKEDFFEISEMEKAVPEVKF